MLVNILRRPDNRPDYPSYTGRTISDADNMPFNGRTMNTQPLHLNENFASRTTFRQRITNCIYARDGSGHYRARTDGRNNVANRGYESVKHLNPVWHGQTGETG